MQDYYEQHDFPNATVQLSFVGTIANICLNGLGPVAQLMLALLHIRVVLFIAVILCVLGLEGASWGSEVRIHLKILHVDLKSPFFLVDLGSIRYTGVYIQRAWKLSTQTDELCLLGCPLWCRCFNHVLRKCF